ncbi:hypothetical protein HanXRQr2_Chr03g0102201 [Helianthus annuus]|uniref:Uncharacterized protein n=1 Tax=Helianthus annuus TaxID=4232 RepID=A0A9K3JEZ0_HELAN|nr:hypothetical protein HanXRQr2_Chr03g0102201 [Helianthus annuus]
MASYFSSLMLAAREAMEEEANGYRRHHSYSGSIDSGNVHDDGYHEYFDHETGQFRSLLMVFGRYALKLVVRSSFLFLLQSHKIRSTWRCLIRVKTEWTIPSVFL